MAVHVAGGTFDVATELDIGCSRVLGDVLVPVDVATDVTDVVVDVDCCCCRTIVVVCPGTDCPDVEAYVVSVEASEGC